MSILNLDVRGGLCTLLILILVSLPAVGCGNGNGNGPEPEPEPKPARSLLFQVSDEVAALSQMESDDPTVGTDGDDSDSDGLTDKVEEQLGTDANNKDTDGDALLDGWEVRGVNGLDLRSKGASPLHKDIFVKMDFMKNTAHDCRPGDGALSAVVEAFAASPVTNPDGVDGIRLHLEMSKTALPTYEALLDPWRQKLVELMATNLPGDHRPVYHYMVWAWRYKGAMGTNSTGISLPDANQLLDLGTQGMGQGFCVTVGPIRDGFATTEIPRAEGGTFMHELGHNLGLRHGGTDEETDKPNHLSVMNYSFQFTGVLRGDKATLDFQPFDVPKLNEAVLVETEGLGKDPALASYYTSYLRNGHLKIAPAGGSLDWNGDGHMWDGTDGDVPKCIPIDLNGNGSKSVLAATINEWLATKFFGGVIGSGKKVDRVWPKSRRQRLALFGGAENHASIERAKKLLKTKPGN